MSIPLIRLQTPADETLLNVDSAPETASDLAYDSDSNGDATSGSLFSKETGSVGLLLS